MRARFAWMVLVACLGAGCGGETHDDHVDAGRDAGPRPTPVDAGGSSCIDVPCMQLLTLLTGSLDPCAGGGMMMPPTGGGGGPTGGFTFCDPDAQALISCLMTSCGGSCGMPGMGGGMPDASCSDGGAPDAGLSECGACVQTECATEVTSCGG